MKAKTTDVRHAETFRHELSVLHQAAIGVVLCRTREPFRAIETVREFAFAERKDLSVWTMTRGWSTYGCSKPDAAPKIDPEKEITVALTKVGGASLENSICVMMYPHWQLSQIAPLIQQVKEYATTFTETRRMLVLVVPPGWTMPPELENDLCILDFHAPSRTELNDIYENLMGFIRDSKRAPKFSTTEVGRILNAGSGMTAQEFENAVSRALAVNARALPNVDISAFVDVVNAVKAEVIKRTDILELMTPDTIDNIGGLENAKDWIRKRAMCFTPEARAAGIETPKGCALIGPPGTGKSALAKAIASILGVPALKLDIGKLFNSLVGSSEARVRMVLALIDSLSPCVLFIDEADKAFAGQASGSVTDSGVGMRVLGAILTWMQETESEVFVVVTANRVENLPSEFLRRGRMDEIFAVTLPNEDERREVFRIHLRKRGHDPEKIGLDAIVAASAGRVPSEIEAAVKDAIIECFVDKRPLDEQAIITELERAVPISVAFKEDFDNMSKWCEANARPASRAEGRNDTVRTRERTPAFPTASTGHGRAMSLDG